MTLFEVMYGYRPDLIVPTRPPTKFSALNSCLLTLQETCKEAKAALHMEKCIIKETFEKEKPPSCEEFTNGSFGGTGRGLKATESR